MNDEALVKEMRHCLRAIERHKANLCTNAGLTTSQFDVLAVLYRQGAMNTGQVRDAIDSTDGTIPVIVRNLIRMNMVQRRSDEKDARKVILSLTPSGSELIEAMLPSYQKMLAECLEVWTPAEKETLQNLLGKVRQ